MQNGRTAAGTPPWTCQNCGATSVRIRKNVTCRHQLAQFLTWLVGKHSPAGSDGMSGRSFRHSTACCWDVQPRLGPATTHMQVLVDGTWIGDLCLLIAVTNALEVLAWRWSSGEYTAA